MKKILISMLIITGFSIAKAETISGDDANRVTPSEYVIALIRASGAEGNRTALWADILRKTNTKVGAVIKTYMVSTRHSPRILFGAEAVAVRKAIENNTQPIEGDIVMANFVMEGNENSITLHSDIHTIEVIEASRVGDVQGVADAVDALVKKEYTETDSCTTCIHKFKIIMEQEKSRALYHRESSCKSNFPQEVFLTKITQK